MSTRQLQIHAYREWTRAPELKRQYHTFDYYWMERYARVYRLTTRIRPVERPLH